MSLLLDFVPGLPICGDFAQVPLANLIAGRVLGRASESIVFLGIRELVVAVSHRYIFAFYSDETQGSSSRAQCERTSTKNVVYNMEQPTADELPSHACNISYRLHSSETCMTSSAPS